MKQILQNLKDGGTTLAEVPVAKPRTGYFLIKTSTTLVSAGTERMMVEFGKGNWLDKARQQPDKVRMVLDKARTDGLATTFEAVQSKLDQPLAPGYCNVGQVIDSGGVAGFLPGDRVVSNGPHAEVVRVPRNLCARVPDAVSDEQAAFAVLGAIGLQGIRLIEPEIGESVVVTGLGLIGLLAVQILRANGCRVMGIDYDPARLELAKGFGAEAIVNPGTGEDVIAAADRFSRGRGVDAVLITASTKSNEPISQAAQMCRKRGRVVLVGVIGLELSRADFYEKEISFQVSCSYGPGRYDSEYEEQGHDYPIGFVRWTEQRNFEAVLDLMAAGSIDVAPLISHRFDLDDAVRAYELLASEEPSLGIILKYPGSVDAESKSVDLSQRTGQDKSPEGQAPTEGRGVVSFIGAGNYAGRVLIPAFRKAGAELHTVVSSGGVSAAHFGKKFGFERAATDWRAAVEDPASDTVVIATRHNQHAEQVIAAIKAGKNVFCEKPLCLTLDELSEIESVATAALPPPQPSPASRGGGKPPILMVGFNRRFAPHTSKLKELLAPINEPKAFVMTVNSGSIPSDHWTQDPAIGGGRIIGEACHFVDLLRYLTGSPITDYAADFADCGNADTASLHLKFADGSIGTVHYLANGNKAVSKERLEVFTAGRVLQLDNFRKLTGHGWKGFSRLSRMRQDKGQASCAATFIESVRTGGLSPIPLDEILEVSRISIELADRYLKANNG